MSDVPTALLEYQALVDRVDKLVAPLFSGYKRHLNCRRGCYFCCVSIELLPVELEYVRRHGLPAPRPKTGLEARDPAPSGSESPLCALLGGEGECTVYDHRPVICRTYGLPLSYRLYEYDQDGREVDPDHPRYMDVWCDLNFKGLDAEHDKAFFDVTGRINMHLLNLEIEDINARFLETGAAGPYHERLADAPPGYGRLPLAVVYDL